MGLYNVWMFKFYAGRLTLNETNLGYIISMWVFLMTLPVTAYIADNWKSRWGRRRQWMYFAAPVYFLVTGLLFYVPPTPHFMSEQAWGTTYYTVMTSLVVVLMYLVLTPYISLGLEMTNNHDERTSLFSISQMTYVAGTVTAFGLPEFLLTHYDRSMASAAADKENTDLFIILNVVNGILGTLAYWIAASFIKERDLEDNENTMAVPLVAGLRFCVLNNKPFLILLCSLSLINTAPYPSTLLPFWIRYTLQLYDGKDAAIQSASLLVLFISSSFIFVPFWQKAALWWGKRKAYMGAYALGFVGYGLFALPQYIQSDSSDSDGSNWPQFWVAVMVVCVCGASGIPLTYSNFLYQSLQGDCVDYDELRTGQRREAQFYNLMQYLNYFACIGSISFPLWLFDEMGFQRRVTWEIRQTIGITLASGALFCLGAGLVFLMYPLSKQMHRAVIAGIAAHRRGEEAIDPITNVPIPPHCNVDVAVQQQYWAANAFAAWELRYWSRLPTITLVQTGAWILATAAFCVLWWRFPNYYWVIGYLAIVSCCFIFYHLARFRVARQMPALGFSDDVVSRHLAGTLYVAGPVYYNLDKEVKLRSAIQ